MGRKIAPSPAVAIRKSILVKNSEDGSVVVSNADKDKRQPTADDRLSEVVDSGGTTVSRSSNNSIWKMYMLKLHKKQSQREWTTLITVVTMYALFGDDVRLIFFLPSADNIFYGLSTVSLVLFAKELIVSTVADNDNRYSFYFWLDFIATVTMLPDIGWVWDPILDSIFNTDNSDIGDLSKGLQASTRVGSKSGRIVRMVRLVRLVRIAKLYKVHKGSAPVEDEFIGEEPSLVGKKMSEMTMQKVMTLVLVMLICLPFFDSTFYSEPTKTMMTAHLGTLHRLPQDYNTSTMAFQYEIQQFGAMFGDVINLEICADYNSNCTRYNNETVGGPNLDEAGILNNWDQNVIKDFVVGSDDDYVGWYNRTEIGDYFRVFEVEEVSVYGCYSQNHTLVPGANCVSFVSVSVKPESQLSASLNIARTIFIMFVLGFGAVAFTKDADTLVIAPIERMIACVKQLAENPMGQTTDDLAVEKEGDDGYETLILERTIKKIGKLLQVGFGEAGAAIINKNMLSSGGVIDPMIKGHKITAVFGFCDIRNFTDTTECLQAEVMVYVNKVGDIVHSATHSFSGAANKNVGDAFLLVWRLEDNAAKPEDLSGSAYFKSNKSGNMCDNALISFLKILIDLKRENKDGGCLHSYKYYPSIQKRFGNDFEIKMGMGLHIGWAIEGAIGSHHKIDASYLSPNVNMSSRLEAATKQFGTPLLLSHWFVDGLTRATKKYCRQIDRVTVKGSLEPMGLWTFDINNYPTHFAEIELNNWLSVPKSQFLSHIVKEEMPTLLEGIDKEFYTIFENGLKEYYAGNWMIAHEKLRESLKHKPDDGPAQSLIRVMSNHTFQAPAQWRGYRELTEK